LPFAFFFYGAAFFGTLLPFAFFFISESVAREKITTLKCKVFSQDLPQFEN